MVFLLICDLGFLLDWCFVGFVRLVVIFGFEFGFSCARWFVLVGFMKLVFLLSFEVWFSFWLGGFVAFTY